MAHDIVTGLNLIPPDPDDPERIMIMGGPGTGKSKAAMSIAANIPDTSTMFVIDNDNAYKRMNSRLKLTNLEVTVIDPLSGWNKGMQAIEAYSKEADEDDWLNLDGMTSMWGACQNSYTLKRYGMDLETYFLKKQKDGDGTMSGFDGNADYQIINPMFNKLYSYIINFPGHVIMTSEMEPLTDKERDPIIKGLFGPVGFKPRGQKRAPHIPHTVLMLSKSRTKIRSFTTIKDREREEVENEEFVTFAVEYLQLTAGWKKAG